MTGNYLAAAEVLAEALRIYRDVDNPGGEAEVLNKIGTLHRACGDFGQARSCHQQALDLARRTGSFLSEAHALAGLGRCILAGGDTAVAEDRLRQALEIFRRIGAAEASDLTAELKMIRTAAHPVQGEFPGHAQGRQHPGPGSSGHRGAPRPRADE